MFDKNEIIKTSYYKFPYSPYIEYEESDIEWAVIGYVKLDKVIITTKKNDKISGQRVDYVDSKIATSEEVLVVKNETISSTINSNPYSGWRPKWNPTLIG